MLFTTEVTIKRNVKTMGEYNRPILKLEVVGTTKGTLSRNRKPYIIQEVVQGVIEEEYTLFYKRGGDIRPHDKLVIDGQEYTAHVPRKYKRHNEITLSYKAEA